MDPLWEELRALDRREHARLDVGLGTCAVCSAGATHVDVVLGVAWARCTPCRVRWHVDGYELTQAPARSDAALAQLMADLAACVDVTVELAERQTAGDTVGPGS